MGAIHAERNTDQATRDRLKRAALGGVLALSLSVAPFWAMADEEESAPAPETVEETAQPVVDEAEAVLEESAEAVTEAAEDATEGVTEQEVSTEDAVVEETAAEEGVAEDAAIDEGGAEEAAAEEAVDEAEPVSVDSILSALADQFNALQSTIGTLDGDLQSQATMITELSNEIASSAEEMNTLMAELADKDALIASLEAQVSDGLESATALTALVDEQDAFIASLEGALGEGQGALEGLGEQYQGAIAEVTRLTQEAAAGAAAMADLDALTAQFETLKQEASTAQEELSAALTSVSELEAAQEEAAAAKRALAQLEAKQDATEHQRFWLAILVALLMVAIGYLMFKGRPEIVTKLTS